MKKIVILMSYIFFSIVILNASDGNTQELGCLFDGLKIETYLQNDSTIRVGHGPDRLMSCRNVLNFDFYYNRLPHTKLFLQVRPVYDAVFDISNDGMGEHAKELRPGWAHNLVRNWDREPFVREVYADINLTPLTLRLGKQIVSWGKSDGFYLLDMINPFNYRNPLTYPEEDLKIPLWMANVNYNFGFGELQFLWIPQWNPTVYPGLKYQEDGYHDWTFNTIGLSNDYYLGVDSLLKSFGFPGLILEEKYPARNFQNSEWGLRWSGVAKGFSYTLNYFSTWTDNYSTMKQVSPYKFLLKPDRLEVIGFSLDRSFSAMGDNVVRLEWAYKRHVPSTLPNLAKVERDHVGYMIGYDRYIFVDWLISFQVWQDITLHPDKAKNAYVGFGANKFTPTMEVANGLVDPTRTQMSALVMKDFLPGDTLHLTVLGLWDTSEGGFWAATRLGYDVSTNLTATVGFNFVWGNEDDFVGQFHDNDNFFFVLKWYPKWLQFDKMT